MDFVSTGAKFSECGEYRYRLHREAEGGHGAAAFLMLNPSTADESVFDPTVRRCWGFIRDWGYRRLEVVNLFALRSTDPKGLYSHPEPVGPDNDQAILDCARDVDLLVCAWGNHGSYLGRSSKVLGMLREAGFDTKCLKVTGQGEPGHPLYLKASLAPVSFT